ncbi:bifunctional abietadiene synthase, chloroplastic [Amborella trichopoda]|nr:bifunctional abietadiene synthase, chloroplastic [Amborella trichopoda]|eukprot:XP_020523152.1 bifunctional abietadiene synthase, chloroplastic [Amborella trichopoda]
MNDGETSPSAYDTAWVARIQATNGTHQPHFPQTLEWILENQLEDGSWGEPTFFLLYDRLVCTLACVLTLTIWNSAGPQLSKGLDFLRRRTKDMEHEPTGLRTCGFEIAFQAMLDEARDLGLDLPYDLPFLKEISQLREKKIKRIPIEVMHSVQTTLLYSLEALQDVVQWENILKLQSRDGSFLSSPSATAVVYMKTGNKKCLDFLTFIVRRFGDHAPAQYPIDLLERIWAIDTIQRLGIDHHFRKEISATLDYVYKNSGKEGVSWGRDNPIPDIDDTCMAFRLLRMHGYPISPDVLEHFKDDDGRFICFRGETHTGISDMFNLYRFSQMSFPREQILKEAKAFSKNHLKGCLENNKVEDKWSLKKALLKEVECALTCPWSMSLPRVEARTYILHHYGESDVWIAKDIYKMPYVNNKSYLELAKLDFNWLQNVYCGELDSVLRWWKDLGINFPVFNLRQPKEIYFSIAATLFEQEYSKCRLACTKCNYIEDSLEELFKSHGSIEDLNLICQGVERYEFKRGMEIPK